MSPYANAQDWKQFLRPLMAAVKNPPADANEFHARCCACADALAIRAEWMTDSKRRDAMARFQFWPSVSELGELFDGDKQHAAWLRERAAIALPAPAAPPPLTDAQKASALAKAAAFRAEMAEQVMAEAPKATARPLAPHHLLAAYEELAARGNEAAKMRAEQLRQAVAQ
jgi:hypothetical protein